MIIYNVTTKLTWKIHDEWVKWMKEIHMPEVVATGCFTHSQLLRIVEIDEEEGPTYAAQYFTQSTENKNEYIEKFAETLRNKAFQEWGNQFISFRSIMEVVH